MPDQNEDEAPALHPLTRRFLKILAGIYAMIALGALVSAVNWWDYTAVSFIYVVLGVVGLTVTSWRLTRGYRYVGIPAERKFLRLFTVGTEFRRLEATWPLITMLLLLVCCVPLAAFLAQPLY